MTPMMKVIMVCLAWICGAIAAGAADFPQVSDCGGFRIENLDFLLNHFTAQWKYTPQSAAALPGGKMRKAAGGEYLLDGVWKTVGGDAELRETIRTLAENEFSYEMDFRQKTGEAPREVALAVALDPVLYFDSPVRVDGRELRFDRNYNASDWQRFLGGVRKLELPLESGVLAIEGQFGLTFQDVRRFQRQEWGIRIKAAQNSMAASLRLRFSFRPFRAETLDIAPVCNMAFADEIAEDGKGGWTDQGPDNDLRSLPLGMNKFGGIDFAVIDPAKNGGRSCIALRGARRRDYPLSATIDSVPESGKYLYLLHAVGWHTGPGVVGHIRFRCADGTEETAEVKMQREVGNFWNPINWPNGAVGWTGRNADASIGLYVSRFPMPAKPVRRITLESAGEIVWLIAGASISDDRIVSRPVERQVIRENSMWRAVHGPYAVRPGSILDFSDLLDAPAGKYGRVVTDGARFTFENAPEKSIRFLGANICFSTNYMEKKWSVKMVDELASLGYNSLRLHHIDRDFPVSRSVKSTELDPGKLDRLEQLVALCKERGIYVTIDLLCSRMPVKGELAEFPDWAPWPGEFKELIFFSDSALESWKEYSRILLNHRNPYTGLCWKDDPVLYAVNLINEDTILGVNENNPRYRHLYDKLFAEYVRAGRLKVDGASPELQRTRFLTALYNDRFAEMKHFLRDEIGLKALIVDQNNWNDIPTTLMRRQYDLVDNHVYWVHPHFTERAWRLPAMIGNNSGVLGYGGGVGRLFPTRIFGKPFIVTEWDHVLPSPSAVEGAFLMGAYAAFQNWNGIYHFAYSHQAERIENDASPLQFFDLSGDPQRLLAERAATVFFLRGDVKPASKATATVISERHLDRDEILRNFPAVSSRAGLLGATGCVITDENEANLPAGTVAAVMVDDASLSLPVPKLAPETTVEKLPAGFGAYDSSRERFTGEFGQLTLDRSAGTFSAVTPMSEGFLLPAGAAMSGDFIRRVKNAEGVFCAVLATSRDGKPLGESRRILLLHLTDSKNSGMTFRDRNCTILEEWGALPQLVRRGAAEIEFSGNLEGFRLYAVDFAGTRLEEIPLKRNAKNSAWTAENFRKDGVVCAYELVKE